MMIKYAVVGAGWISQQAFLPGVGQSANSKVTAIVTSDRDKAARLANYYGVGQIGDYDGYDALLRGSDIDAVYIALPNHLHAHYAVRAARAGKHVLVEKPLATSEQDALAMIAAAREAGVFLMTAYRLHNEPGTVAVLERIRNDAIGRPLFFQSVFSFQAAQGNHRLKAASWGGPLQDVGVYCVNAARHIFAEEPIEAMAMVHRPNDDPRFREVEASVAALLRFPSGGLPQFVASFGAADVDSYRLSERRAISNSTPASGSRQQQNSVCAATARSAKLSFRKSTILARRSNTFQIASRLERRPRLVARRGWRTCAHWSQLKRLP